MGVAAFGFASPLGALVISLTVGLSGFRESIGAPVVVLSIVIEWVAIVLLAGWTVLVALAGNCRTSYLAAAGSVVGAGGYCASIRNTQGSASR